MASNELSAESQRWLQTELEEADYHTVKALREALAMLDQLAAREARVRAVLPKLNVLARGLVEHALDGAS